MMVVMMVTNLVEISAVLPGIRAHCSKVYGFSWRLQRLQSGVGAACSLHQLCKGHDVKLKVALHKAQAVHRADMSRYQLVLCPDMAR